MPLHRLYVFLLTGQLALAGCSGTVPVTRVLRDETLPLSSERPLEINGQKLGVDGIPANEEVSVRVRHIVAPTGDTVVDIDTVPDK